MLIIAHRGFSSRYTQNTMVAFAQALLLNIDAIELDVHQVEDEFMVFHDPYVDSLTNGKGRIYDMPLSEVRQLLIKDKDPIPTLNEVAELIGDQVVLNIEIKSLQSIQHFVQYVKNLIILYRCRLIISSFDHPVLAAIQDSFSDEIEELSEQDPSPPVEFAALIAHSPFDHAKYASNLGVSIAAIDCNAVNSDFVEDAHKRGLKVWCYTVNHKVTLLELIDIGVDGVFTDRPDWARQIIDEHNHN